MIGIPPIHEIISLLFDEEKCKRFLFQIGAFYQHRDCTSCNTSMKFYDSDMRWKCPKKDCRKSISYKANTFFSRSNLQNSKILYIGYLWLTKSSVDTAIIHTGLSGHAICDWYEYYRQLISSNPNIEDNIIGGENVIVQVDECKIGKRKYNRGHVVEGVWLLGGVEITEERKTFIVPVDHRDAQTLLPIIEAHVRPGSIIHTDMWRAYAGLTELGFSHLTVNHSINFTDPDTGINTNTIEGTWNGLKICIKPRNRIRVGIEGRISEFQWRRKFKGNEWEGLLKQLAETHFHE